jgi:hypothetical protein
VNLTLEKLAKTMSRRFGISKSDAYKRILEGILSGELKAFVPDDNGVIRPLNLDDRPPEWVLDSWINNK